ncbi:flavodoxin [Lysinibacillus phage vB_LfM_LysYB1]|nr:flavodoxin [Lysinibacillus phage vB_LfM_LysYB1]WAB25218.1 flavodoxin [Lysinibacillus phage vB_LfM_LysYB2]
MVRELNVLIAFESMSGNTMEVAEIIEKTAQENGHNVTRYRIGSESSFPVVSDYDVFIIGTYTWGKGLTPKRTKSFVAKVGYKPAVVYVFGTGDTQFGGAELFCAAATKLGKFYETQYPVLKIEQSPRGSQEELVVDWTKGVFKCEETRNC